MQQRTSPTGVLQVLNKRGRWVSKARHDLGMRAYRKPGVKQALADGRAQRAYMRESGVACKRKSKSVKGRYYACTTKGTARRAGSGIVCGRRSKADPKKYGYCGVPV